MFLLCLLVYELQNFEVGNLFDPADLAILSTFSRADLVVFLTTPVVLLSFFLSNLDTRESKLADNGFQVFIGLYMISSVRY